MEILAGLVKIDALKRLPVPWYNRPALGLKSGTPVHISTVLRGQKGIRVRRSARHRQTPPDIIISPLDPSRFHLTRSLTIDLPEGSGVIGRVLKIISEYFNIDLMETATINQRQLHRTVFVIRPIENYKSDFLDDPDSFLATHVYFPIATNVGGEIVRCDPFTNLSIVHSPGQYGKVLDSFINVESTASFIKDKYDTPDSEFDFSRVVISSNTEARFLRYIFPKKGSFEIKISHKDLPGAMQGISQSLNELGYNILLSRISKSQPEDTSRHRESETIMICEPSTRLAIRALSNHSLTKIKSEIKAKLVGVDERRASASQETYYYYVGERDITRGRSSKSIIDIVHTEKKSKKVLIPRDSAHFLDYPVYRNIGRKLFVSAPGAVNKFSEARQIWSIIRDLCALKGIAMYDGYETPRSNVNVTPDEIWARMWIADAHIFVGGGDDGSDWLRVEQKIEWGFAHAICERVRIVCRDEAARNLPKGFMIPNQSMTTFTTLGEQDESLRKQLADLLNEWFP